MEGCATAWQARDSSSNDSSGMGADLAVREAGHVDGGMDAA
jgi:hypothetical protein